MATATTGNATGFGAPSNTRQIAVVVAISVVAIAAASYFMSSRDTKSEAARSALFLAEKSLEDETKALTPAPPADQADAAKDAKDPKAKDAKNKTPPKKAPAKPTADITFKRLDVDAQFPAAVKKLNGVLTDFPGTRSAFDARMQLGELYFNHGEAAKALPLYKTAVDEAPNSLEKALALAALGATLENQSQFKDARDTYEKAINLGEGSVKADLLLSVARTSRALKDSAKAKQAYDQILKDLPNTEQARYAEAFKAELE